MKFLLCILLNSFIFQSMIVSAQKPETTDDNWDVNNPPGESYQAKIDVTEGTWMNVTMSPDGETLVFDLLGDLYSLPIKGGSATALTHSVAWEMQPQFSPNGKQIAFTSDASGGDNIWVMDIDGNNHRQITQEKFRLLNSPTWSPDGQYIAARKHFTSQRSLGAGEIWLYHIGGGKGLQLNKRPNDQKDIGEPAFSIDGKKIFFSRDSTSGKNFKYNKNVNATIYEIFSIDRNGGKIKKEISGAGGSIRPTPSPDGKYLAFVRRIRNQSNLFLKNLETGKEFSIYQKLDRDMQETWAIHGVYPTLVWTPDSQNIIFWAGGKIHKLNKTTQVATEIPFHINTHKTLRKTVKTQVNPAPENFELKMIRWPQVNPNGDNLVFQALGKLYIQKLPNGKPKRLTKSKNEFEFYPSFSKDGKWIVYTTWNDKQQGTIKKVKTKGGKGIKITKNPGKYISPRFSNDGRLIVFKKVSGHSIISPVYNLNPGIYQVSAKGGQEKFITEKGSSPFFSKNGLRIFVTLFEDEKTQLVSLDLNGRNPIISASAMYTTEFSLSPNEDYLAFRERYQLYLTPFTQAANTISVSSTTKNLPVYSLSNQGGKYFSWNKNGTIIHWSQGASIYSKKIPDPTLWETDIEDSKPKENKIAIQVKSDIPKGNTLLSGATIITMQGDKVFQEGDILISGNRIQAIGNMNSFKVPDNAKRINVKGKTIIPGIVDVHWHGNQGTYQITPQQNWYNLATLAFGVTTIHDPSNNTQEIFSAAELAKTSALVAPRIFSTGTILYGAKTDITAEINVLNDASNHLNRLKSQGAFSVKSYNQPRRDQRQKIIEAARQTEMMVVPEGGSTFQHNLTMIIDGHTGIEHSIPLAAVYSDVNQLWSQSQTAYTPTLIVAYGGIWGENYWYQKSDVWKHPLLSKYVPQQVLRPRSIRRTMAPEEDYNHVKIAKVASQLQKLDIPIQLGAHGQREGLGAHWEMWMFGQGGMSTLEIIRAATINGAKYLGMDQHLGSLEPGKLADLVVIDADIFKNIQSSDQVSMVMLNGRLYESKTMNEIGNHPKKRDKLYFE